MKGQRSSTIVRAADRPPETDRPRDAAFPYARRERWGLSLVLGCYLATSLPLVVAITWAYHWVIADAWDLRSPWLPPPGISGFQWLQFVGWLRDGEFLAGTLVGYVGSYLLGLLIWTTLFRGSNLLRILLGGVVAVAGGIWIITWGQWTQQSYAPMEVRHPIILPTIVFICTQLPFWFLREGLSWRVTLAGEERSRRTGVRKLYLSDIFAWTFFVAVLMGIVRGLTLPGGQTEGSLYILQLTITLIVCTIACFIVGWVFLWTTLQSRRPFVGFVLTVLGTYVVLLAARLTLVSWIGSPLLWPVSWYGFRRELDPSWSFAMGGTMGVALGLVPLTVIARSVGWRLVRGRLA